jgi:hypothetical protein
MVKGFEKELPAVAIGAAVEIVGEYRHALGLMLEPLWALPHRHHIFPRLFATASPLSNLMPT